jgi:quinol monooxygenase YgiN
MAEVVVVGAFTAKPGQEQAAAEAMQQLIGPTHEEDGCILYSLHRGVDDPARLSFIERWSSREALNAHLGSDHVQAALARIPDLFDANDITVFEPLPGGQEKKGSLAAHAGG